jgi:hypothetical protein
MRPHRLTLLATLLLAATAGAQAPASSYEDLFARASAAYSAEDWPRCAEAFAKAAEVATAERLAARAYFAAAACTAAKGDKDAAFALLDKAAAKGYRATERAQSNPNLDPLRQDPRWKTFFEGVQARSAAYEATINAELARLYHEDQADRQGGPNSNINWQAVSKRDAERRQRVLEIAGKGGLKTADDYYHAAMVFQHSDKTEDYERAHQWCLKAVELDPAHPSARWLAAATKDRYLMSQGKPQLYGTQFKKVDGKWILWEVDPSVTDEERAKWDVPPLAESKKLVEQMNAGGQ